MAADKVQSGRAIEQGAPELLRIWRLARAAAKRELGAGLLDNVMGDFLTRAGKLLGDDKTPEEVWQGVVGILKVSPQKGPDALTEEWAIAMEVLTAACEALEAEAEVGDWLAKAVAAAEKGTLAALEKKESAPDGLMVLHSYTQVMPIPVGPGGSPEAEDNAPPGPDGDSEDPKKEGE
jgi:hypothetical protein